MSERVAITDELYYAPLGEWIENHTYPSQDGGLVTFQRYITARKKTEEELRKTQEELAHISRVTVMGELAASIAHEINQPLAAIVNNSNACLELMGTPGTEERKREALLDIVNDANRASAIIARVRALAKRSTSETRSLSVKDLVTEVLTLAYHAALKTGVTIKTSLPARLRVTGDRIQLQQLLLNLVINGIDAMSPVDRKGKIMNIRAKRSEIENKPALVISVEDCGRGLGANEERIFEPFFTTKPEGMGMGLGISRSIAEAHGGRLWVTQNDGPGATFHCLLPLKSEGAP
jgi:C4-dicarboxylate-specific signal transduction histidine kinase